MRSSWSGAITFGLVNIPIKLYVASETKTLDLDMLHKKDFSRIRYAKICKAEEKEVPYEEIIKGYEVNKDDYVVISEKEIKNANVKKSNSIEIAQFVNEDEIDSIYFEKPYYIEPGKNAEKSYKLLFEAIKRAGKVGVAKFVLRTRESVGVIKPYKNLLLLMQMRYQRDIRKTDELAIPKDTEVKENEIKMAMEFIKQLTEPFEPGKFRDTYREELEALIEKKAKGEKIEPAEQKIQTTKSQDLMQLLKQSLEQHKTVQ